ncbi:MAG: putative porin [Saprospiraceae bacterium]|nr:putative porin [Saprospiraceae bacterium]
MPFFRNTVGFVVFCFLFLQLQAQDNSIIYYEGSSTIANFIRDAEPVYGKVSFVIKTDTESAGGELSILEGTSDIGGVAKIPGSRTLSKGVISTLIGWDAIAVITHSDNPVKNLSQDQLKAIFTSKITNWKELGGPDLKINPYVVNKESATRNVFRSRVLGEEDYQGCTIVAPDKKIAATVEQDPGGIGQLSFSFLRNQPDINVLAINGQQASVDNQSYPITRPLYLLTWPGRQLTANFAIWTQTPEAQAIIKKRFIGTTQSSIVQSGSLIVFTKTQSIEEGGTYFYPHEPYEIYTKEGDYLQTVVNHLDPLDENPSIVSLPPNQYLIWTETDKKNGDSKILVNIETDITTRVFIDATQKDEERSTSSESNTRQQLNLFGDFRFRFEQDWNSLRQDSTYRHDRGRLRYRLRFGFNYQLNEHVIFGGRLRSGDLRNTQSPHVTLGSDLTAHSVAIDRAFARVNYANMWFWMGKNNLPFWKENEMWWDDDITPEGVAMGGFFDHSKKLRIKPTFGYFLLNDLGRQLSENAYFLGGQLKLEYHHLNADVNLASGYFNFSNVPDKNDVTNSHTVDYKIINSSLEVKLKTQIPIAFGVDNFISLEDYSDDPIITGLQLDKEKIGYVASVKFGGLNKQGNVLFSYYYANIPKYAVVDFLAQDDWLRWDLGNAIGTRSSNFKGHEFRLAYSISRGVNLVSRAFFASAIKNEFVAQEALETSNRFRIDINFKF